jgi:isoleucyl-tRNA synthetase
MREQIRLWFYSQFFMSVTLSAGRRTGRVLTYEKLLDETGREMHRVVGQLDRCERGVRPDGRRRDALALLRRLARQNLKFGFGPAGEVKRRLLTLWNSVSFFGHVREHRGLPADVLRPRRRAERHASARRLARCEDGPAGQAR